MEHPEDGYGLGELLVKLEVDAKIAKTWYEAK
jgi:DNA polymerase I-like protein with 3'-5' exonuclease and polymerase domains